MEVQNLKSDNEPTYKMMLVEDLVPYARNAKKHDKKQIDNVAKSISEFGMVQPIVVDRDNNVIIGHCRLLACKKLKYTEVPVVKLEDLTPEEANKLRLLDNKLNESDWDFDLLAEDVPDINFDGYEVDWKLPEIKEDTNIIEDEAPEEVDTRCKPGDIWQLGKHRLICGDSTDITVIEKLMNGEKADMLLTDPPYNVDYEGTAGKIKNDKMDDAPFRQFLRDAFLAADAVMRPGAVFYIWHSGTEAYNFIGGIRDAGWMLKEVLIWVKDSLVMGRQDYQWQHEPCLYGWKEGASHLWASDRKQTALLKFDKPKKNDMHPTMKPVALFGYQICNNTHESDKVLDLFGGSGTAIMACEQLNRICFTCELDPHFCDVIITRWENFTNQKAVLLNG